MGGLIKNPFHGGGMDIFWNYKMFPPTDGWNTSQTKQALFFCENLSTVRGVKWSFKNSGSRKILVEFYGSRSLVF